MLMAMVLDRAHMGFKCPRTFDHVMHIITFVLVATLINPSNKSNLVLTGGSLLPFTQHKNKEVCQKHVGHNPQACS